MAEYNIHYRISYYRFSGGQTTIDILEKGYIDDSDGDASSEAGPEIINLEAAGSPLEIMTEGDSENIYKNPTLGSGAVIRVMAQPLTLQNLFTIDPQKFIVKIYNGASGENLFWQGFINTGIYTESYSTPSSLMHEIVIYCNNGMKVLEDIPYTQTLGGAKYTGFDTIGGIMDNILSKLEITFTYVRTNSLLTYGTGIYEDTTNLFSALKVNNENYYDESDEPMSCREVMDSIFGAFGWVCTFKGTNIVIIDPLDLQDIYHGHRYDAVPFGDNEASLGLGEHLNLSTGAVEWAETGGEVDIIMPYNNIDLTYDPYTFTESGYDFNGAGNGTLGPVSTEITNNGVTYTLWTQSTMENWTLTGSAIYFIAQQQTDPNEDNPEFFIRMSPSAADGNYFEYTFPNSNIKQDDNLMLELSMNVLVNTRHASNIYNPAEASSLVAALYMYGFKLQIGDKFFNKPHGTGASWSTDSNNTFEVYVRETDAEVQAGYYIHGTWFRRKRYVPEYDTSEIQDKRITAVVYIPIAAANITGDLLAGSIKLFVPQKLTGTPLTGIVNVLISDVNIAVVNSNKVPVSNDGVKATGTISSAVNMKKSVLNIKLTTGIGSNGASKGALSSDLQATEPGINITGLKRLLTGTHYTLNQLLLQSLLSQYGTPRLKLHGKLDVTNWINDLGMYYNLIYDSNHLVNEDTSVKKFTIVSSTYNDREETLQVDMIELANSREDIV